MPRADSCAGSIVSGAGTIRGTIVCVPEAEPAESPWALQIAVRVEKANPPTTAAACAAAALATIELLDDERSLPGGIWQTAVETWNGARIRKIVRRARASAWERAQSASGVTVERDGAEARAFVPSRMADAPSEVSKLQIRSTPLDQVEPVAALPPIATGSLVVAVTPHFEMSWGKQAAQCAHAAQRAWMTADATVTERWDRAGRPIVVVHPTVDLWGSLDDLATTRIHDGGFTEIPPGTNSSLAWFVPGPDATEEPELR